MLKIHFLNVGHGDCCIIEFDSGRTAMVDINRSSTLDEASAQEILKENTSFGILKRERLLYSESNNFELLKENAGYNIELTDPIEYLDDNNLNTIFRFISTHPHMDHLLGLNSLNDNYTIDNIWITDNSFLKDRDELGEVQKDDWNLYKKYRENISKNVDNTKVLSLKHGAEGEYYTNDGVYILAPNDNLVKTSEEKDKPNIMSTVLLIKYGECKIVLGGDAENDTWEFIKDNYFEDIKNINILGAAHHGRDSGYHQESVKQMNPEYTIVSVGNKPDNDSSNKYRNYSDNVYSTRWKGNIVFTCYKSGNVYSKCQYDR